MTKFTKLWQSESLKVFIIHSQIHIILSSWTIIINDILNWFIIGFWYMNSEVHLVPYSIRESIKSDYDFHKVRCKSCRVWTSWFVIYLDCAALHCHGVDRSHSLAVAAGRENCPLLCFHKHNITSDPWTCRKFRKHLELETTLRWNRWPRKAYIQHYSVLTWWQGWHEINLLSKSVFLYSRKRMTS